MIIDTKYKILTNGEVNVFITSLTENEFLKTLDAVYGKNNYNIVEIEQMF